MNMRERMLAVIRGEELDRVPFVQYDGLVAPNEDVWEKIGRENMGVLRWCYLYRFDTPNCKLESEKINLNGLNGTRTVLFTPEGNLTELQINNSLEVGAIREHFVKEPNDYKILMSYLRDITLRENLDEILRIPGELGDDGIPFPAIARTPFQQLWIQWVNLDDFVFHMADAPDIVEECIGMLTDLEKRIFDLMYAAADKVDLPLINIPDNITAPVIGEKNFRKYCVSLYDELADMMAEKGIPITVHMDGNLKPLWKAIGESKVRGIDSFSPVPDNDTSVSQAIQMWPQMRLFVNFPSSVHLANEEKVYEMAHQILAEGGGTGRMWIQISEDMPPNRWQASFPAIVRAIEEFSRS